MSLHRNEHIYQVVCPLWLIMGDHVPCPSDNHLQIKNYNDSLHNSETYYTCTMYSLPA